jgi:hypothetical protein
MTTLPSWSQPSRTRISSADDDDYRTVQYSQSVEVIEKRLRALKLPKVVIENHISALRKSRAVPRKKLVKFNSAGRAVYRALTPRQLERLRREWNPGPTEWAATRP